MQRQRVVFVFLFLLISIHALALSPSDYIQQVLQRDIPRSLQWLERLSHAPQFSQVEVYQLYKTSLPEIQDNNQLGISVKGSIERMILLLEGSQHFMEVQKTSVELKERKENVLKVLQSVKDEMDRFQFGEDPQSLLEEWQNLKVDMNPFISELVETFLQLEKVINTLEVATIETEPEAAKDSTMMVLEPSENESFEKLRFESYIGSVEAGQIAEECQGAVEWKTDQAELCRHDDSLECDRKYARRCKRLQ